MSNIPAVTEPNTLQSMKTPESLLYWTQQRLKETPDPTQIKDIPNLIFVTGTSGSGKGTWVRNLIRATHCLNRDDGQEGGCGYCESCRSDPRDSNELQNIVWVECGSRHGETDYKKIQHAMSVAKAGPYPTGNPHRDILYIVFDEAHLLSTDNLSSLLTISEHNANDVKFVGITAEPEEIKPTVFKMLKSRGIHVQLPTPTPTQIANHLQFIIEKGYEGLPDSVPEESIHLISQKAEGSYREAIQLLSQVYSYDPYCSPDIVASSIHTLTWGQRKYLWELLSNSKTSRQKLREAIQGVNQQVDSQTLARLLLEDLYNSEACNEDHNFTAISLLTDWLRFPYLYDLKYALIQLKGLNCVDLELSDNDDSFEASRDSMEKLYGIG